MNINVKFLWVAALLFVALIGFIVYLEAKQPPDKPKYTFDPSFEMIDPKNPSTMVERILKLKNQNDNLTREQCLISQLKPFVQNKLESYRRLIPPTSLYGKDKQLSSRTFSFFRDVHPNEVFNFNFEAADDCNLDESSGASLGSTMTYRIYDNIEHLYADQMQQTLTSLGIFIDMTPRSTLNPGYNDYYRSRPLFSASPAVANVSDTSKYDPKILQGIPSLAVNAMTSILNEMDKRWKIADSTINSNKESYTKKVDEYTNSRTDINDKAIRYGIVAFCFTAITMYIAGLYSRNRLRRFGNKDNPNFNDDFRSSMWYSVYLITVLLLIITIFILGLAKLLGENSLAALLGSIAGYVLNSKAQEAKSPTAPATPTQQTVAHTE